MLCFHFLLDSIIENNAVITSKSDKRFKIATLSVTNNDFISYTVVCAMCVQLYDYVANMKSRISFNVMLLNVG